MTAVAPTAHERDLLALLRDARDAAARIGLLMRDGERDAVSDAWVEIVQRIDAALGGGLWRTSASIPGPTIPTAGPSSPASSGAAGPATAAAPTGSYKSTTATADQTTAPGGTLKCSAAPAISGSTAGASRIATREG